MSAVWEGYRAQPRTLDGAKILHIVPSLREEPETRIALATANALQQAGARTIIAGASGPLVDVAQSTGAEWLPLAEATINPVKLRRNVLALEQFAAHERIDILHAVGAGPAWSARAVARRLPLWTVTSLPDAPARRSPVYHFLDAARAAGDRVVTSSAYAARSWIGRYRIGGGRIAIIPRPVDVAQFSPSAVSPQRIAAMRHSWAVRWADRVILVPGQLSQGNGQSVLIDVARTLLNGGARNLVFVLAGPKPTKVADTQTFVRRVQEQGVEALFRIAGTPRDLPAALAAAYVVTVPAREPPMLFPVAAQAQAMARPVIASEIGVLPENLLAPPRMDKSLRTGWLAKPNSVASLGRALHLALTLDGMEYQAMAARARQFAEFMFAPESVAAANRAVYTSLLARDG
jgi:glycosyltransferase involved in cell wall biosynthesis